MIVQSQILTLDRSCSFRKEKVCCCRKRHSCDSVLALRRSFFFYRSTRDPLAQHQSQLLPAFIWNEAQQPLHREKVQHAI